MAAVTKRSSMTFFSDPQSHYSHRVRIVLAEKGVTVDVVNVDPSNPPAELADLNPYNALPTLVDRDLVLYEPNIMMEYLDERFPHPPLLPVYPVARAQSRLMMWRVGRDWCSLVDRIEAGSNDKDADQARKELRESLVASAPLFQEMPFFLSEEFTMADCCIGPLLWRLPVLGVELPQKGIKPLEQYMERLFERRGFKASLSDVEEDMRT
ncbi:stringent starvation protein A [Halovibrio salipaludis]|uniref:Stringent starvation protein A n=1 Tax=Halovibrio salipaludis TaxID=2032626 RepID=A0A2A2F5S6_9GAMM|nr:glutathione S-transferase N-terminal domain-containing protein [Halovibrio salipaludis]PAU79955.1 stringent starvation protein A [Halovibrio salipaludis]